MLKEISKATVSTVIRGAALPLWLRFRAEGYSQLPVDQMKDMWKQGIGVVGLYKIFGEIISFKGMTGSLNLPPINERMKTTGSSSIFEPLYWYTKAPIAFMKDLVGDISVSMAPFALAHLAYVAQLSNIELANVGVMDGVGLIGAGLFAKRLLWDLPRSFKD